MSNPLTALEHEISNLIVDTLDLEDIKPEDIDRKALLFGDGLGLDSIDALEIGAALSKRYKITLKSQAEDAHMHFESVKSLAEFVLENTTENTNTSVEK